MSTNAAVMVTRLPRVGPEAETRSCRPSFSSCLLVPLLLLRLLLLLLLCMWSIRGSSACAIRVIQSYGGDGFAARSFYWSGRTHFAGPAPPPRRTPRLQRGTHRRQRGQGWAGSTERAQELERRSWGGAESGLGFGVAWLSKWIASEMTKEVITLQLGESHIHAGAFEGLHDEIQAEVDVLDNILQEDESTAEQLQLFAPPQMPQ